MEKMFSLLPSDQTNIHFNNLLDENTEQNVYTYMNIYTGAGVAAGDINNDGLVDLFFSGGQVASRIYFNKGGLVFEDITESSGINNVTWATGAVMADVNQDGWQDIYVCTSGFVALSTASDFSFQRNTPVRARCPQVLINEA